MREWMRKRLAVMCASELAARPLPLKRLQPQSPSRGFSRATA